MASSCKARGAARDEGVIGNYLHFDNRLAVIVEVNCETDFVAATDQFKAFAKDIAMHIANMSPKYVKREDVPEDIVGGGNPACNWSARLDEGKPEHIAEKIVAGRMNKWYEDIVLMEQSFIKDDDKTVRSILARNGRRSRRNDQHRPLSSASPSAMRVEPLRRNTRHYRASSRHAAPSPHGDKSRGSCLFDL